MDSYLIFILPTVFFFLGMLVGYSMNRKKKGVYEICERCGKTIE